ncbi:CbiQ family ECF transporter T component [Stappia indica]|uniref:CbiQ family ECF transporter T component n=1 Tax=Stappia indica TaxID=538381 RepID=UPI001CD7372E|nr:energy-coupling factor transporter transmembrane protein EcfT [Stappia indica]MCA1298368.1 energy-coupling factor transporter transmembrane protein EcfT [Stappia indica]
MTGVYLEGRSWLHRLPAWVKLVCLAVMSMLLFPVTDLTLLAGALAGTLSIYASLGRSALAALTALRPVFFLLVCLLLFHLVLGSLATGLVMLLRLVCLVLLASIVSLTTRLDDMIDALAPVLRPAELVGLSRRRLALAIALVLRFAPQLAAAGGQLGAAYRARTGRRGGLRLVAPLALQALNTADHVAEAIAARGGVDPRPVDPAPLTRRPM